jgi:hypothetical protein
MTHWYWAYSDNTSKWVTANKMVYCSGNETSGTKASFEGFEDADDSFSETSVHYTMLCPRRYNADFWDVTSCSLVHCYQRFTHSSTMKMETAVPSKHP